MESTEALVLIKPNGLVEAKYRTILEFLSLNLIEEVDRKLVWLNDTQLKNIYPACIDRKNYQTWSDSITSGISLALKVRGEGIVFKLLEIEAELKELLGEVANKSGDDSVEITQEIDEASQELDAIFNNSVKEVKSTDYKIDFEKWSKTRAKHTKVQTTVVILKPDVAQNPDNVKRIKEIITNRGFRICSSREKRLSRKDAIRLCKNEGREWSEKEIIFLSTSDSIIMEIEGEEAVFSLNVMAGTRDPEKCEEKQSLRCRFGTDKIKNAIYTSPSKRIAEEDIEAVKIENGYSEKVDTVGRIKEVNEVQDRFEADGCKYEALVQTVMVVKPYAVKYNENIRNMILANGFKIENEITADLDKDIAEKLFESDKKYPVFPKHVASMLEGPSVCYILSKDDAVSDGLSLVGDKNPKASRGIGTIRSKYGSNIIKNVVYVSENSSDAARDIETIRSLPEFLSMTASEEAGKNEVEKELVGNSGADVVEEERIEEHKSADELGSASTNSSLLESGNSPSDFSKEDLRFKDHIIIDPEEKHSADTVSETDVDEATVLGVVTTDNVSNALGNANVHCIEEIETNHRDRSIEPELGVDNTLSTLNDLVIVAIDGSMKSNSLKKTVGGTLNQSVEKRIKNPIEESIEKPVEKIVEKIVQKSVKETVEKPAEKSVEKPVKETVEKIVQKSVKETVEKPAEETVEKPIKETVEKPAEETVEKPIKETVEKPVKETVEKIVQKPVKETVEKPAEEKVEKPIKETVEKPVKETVEKIVQKPVKETVEKPAEETVEKIAQKPVKETVERPAEETVEKPIKETVEKPVKETVEKIVQKPVKETVEKIVEKPVKETVEKIVQKPVKETAEKPAEETVEKPAEETVEKIVQKPVKETVERPAEETVEKPIKETVEKPVKETVEKIVQKPVKETVEKIVQKPVKETVEKIVQKPVKETVEKPAEETVEKPAEETVEKIVQKPVKETVERPAEETVEKPVKETVEKIVQKPVKETVEKPAEETVEKPAEETVEKIVQKPVKETAEKPAEETVEKPAEETVEKIVQKPVKETVERPAEETVEKPVKETVEKIVQKPVKETVEKIVQKPVKETVEKIVQKPVKETVEKIVEKPVKETAEKTVEKKVYTKQTESTEDIIEIPKSDENDEKPATIPEATEQPPDQKQLEHTFKKSKPVSQLPNTPSAATSQKQKAVESLLDKGSKKADSSTAESSKSSHHNPKRPPPKTLSVSVLNKVKNSPFVQRDKTLLSEGHQPVVLPSNSPKASPVPGPNFSSSTNSIPSSNSLSVPPISNILPSSSSRPTSPLAPLLQKPSLISSVSAAVKSINTRSAAPRKNFTTTTTSIMASRVRPPPASSAPRPRPTPQSITTLKSRQSSQPKPTTLPKSNPESKSKSASTTVPSSSSSNTKTKPPLQTTPRTAQQQPASSTSISTARKTKPLLPKFSPKHTPSTSFFAPAPPRTSTPTKSSHSISEPTLNSSSLFISSKPPTHSTPPKTTVSNPNLNSSNSARKTTRKPPIPHFSNSPSKRPREIPKATTTLPPNREDQSHLKPLIISTSKTGE